MPDSRELLDQAWAALGGRPEHTASVELAGPASVLPSRLPVTASAQAAVAAAALAAAELLGVRRGTPPPVVRADSRAVGVAVRSERHLRVDGRPLLRGNPLSDFHPTGQGWIRLHGNYPHHRAALARALGLPAGTDPTVDDVLPVLAVRSAIEVEDAVVAAGGVAAATRTADEWLAHPQGAAVAALPLLSLDQDVASDPADPIPGAEPGPSGVLPMGGLRVLDLTRVIAGPVSTRTLAVLGADVLRVDSPNLPENPEQHLDTGPGKRSTRLDLARPSDRTTFDELLETADVVVTGYRPGALRGLGLGVPDLLTRRPDLVVVNLCAWGLSGPWAGRRGFDSLVQSASGIGLLEAGGADGSVAGGKPGVMPAQALDHATGYLAAAAALRGLTHRFTDGGGWHAELSLAQTAAWLLRAGQTPPPADEPTADPGPWLYDSDTPDGRITLARSPLEVDGVPRTWPHPPVPWGSSPPSWRR